MKKISIFLLATVIINSAIGQTIWDDFDNPENVVYAYHDGIGFDQMFTIQQQEELTQAESALATIEIQEYCMM